jgi:hypothetical protein
VSTELKEILTILGSALTIIATVAGCTAAIMSKMATKVDMEKLDKKLSADLEKLDKKVDGLKDSKADKDAMNQRLLSVESFLRMPRPVSIAEATMAEKEKEVR